MKSKVVDVGGMSITIYRDDPLLLKDSWEVSSHFHTFYELHFIRRGKAELYIENDYFTLSQNQACFMPKNCVHFTKSVTEDLLFYSLSFSVSKKDKSDTGVFSLGEYHKLLDGISRHCIIEDSGIAAAFNDIPVADDLTANPFYEQIELAHIVMIVLKTINHFAAKTLASQETTKDKKDSFYTGMLLVIDRFISSRFMDDIKLADLAKEFCLSERQMNRVFLELTGENFHKVLLRQRMNTAKMYILKGSKSLTEISLLCGYKSYSGFFAAFSRYFGIPPEKLRELSK